MAESEYERGFAAGFERGFEAGQRRGVDPMVVPSVWPANNTDCGCPGWQACNSKACPRRMTVTTTTWPPSTSGGASSYKLDPTKVQVSRTEGWN